VYTSVPSDYCDKDVIGIVQQAPSDVNSLEKEGHRDGEERNRLFKTLRRSLSY
jgi:hypothetical protein